jgi:hypothetical protein
LPSVYSAIPRLITNKQVHDFPYLFETDKKDSSSLR